MSHMVNLLVAVLCLLTLMSVHEATLLYHRKPILNYLVRYKLGQIKSKLRNHHGYYGYAPAFPFGHAAIGPTAFGPTGHSGPAAAFGHHPNEEHYHHYYIEPYPGHGAIPLSPSHAPIPVAPNHHLGLFPKAVPHLPLQHEVPIHKGLGVPLPLPPPLHDSSSYHKAVFPTPPLHGHSAHSYFSFKAPVLGTNINYSHFWDRADTYAKTHLTHPHS